MPCTPSWPSGLQGCLPGRLPGPLRQQPRRRAAHRPGRFLDLEGIGGRMAHTWGTLLDYVRTGQPAYQELFGRPFWEDLAAHPKIAADFDALMGPAGHGVPDFDIELTGGWDGLRTMVDVGGGTGAMLASLLRRHPHVRGILVDFPGTVARASEILTSAGGGRPGDAPRAELLRPAARRGRPVPAEERAERLARRADGGHPPPLRRGRRAAAPPRPPARRPPSPPAGSPSSAASHPTTHPAPWASTCWSRAGRPVPSPSSPNWPGEPGSRSSPPPAQASGRYVVECRPASHTTPDD